MLAVRTGHSAATLRPTTSSCVAFAKISVANAPLSVAKPICQTNSTN